MDNLRFVARTGSQLQMFVDFIGTMRRWGRGLRRAVAGWYLDKHVKYRQRYNWTHRDLLRKAHPKARAIDKDMNALLAWITHGTLPSWDDHPNLRLIYGYESAQTQSVTVLAKLIEEYDLTWEMVPTAMLKEKEVWKALSKRMPLTALLRNLATLTRVGVIAPMQSKWVCQRLINGIGGSHGQAGQPGEGSGGGQGGAGGSRPGIHPIAILSALLTYRAGKGARGKHTCTPVPQVMDALDLVSGRSFNHAPQTNKRLYLGIDVSGSMGHGEVAGVPGLSPRMAAAAMAMVIARREPNYYMAGFSASTQNRWDPGSSHMSPLNITASDSISDAMQKTQDLPFGRTDCALPVLDAMQKNIPVDCFIILTDSETWAGNIHPVEALRQYRRKMNIPAKLIVVGMVSNEFSIADPDDAGMLDIVGFDSAAPELIADFTQEGADA